MAKVIIETKTLTDIANAIRDVNNTTDNLDPATFAENIKFNNPFEGITTYRLLFQNTYPVYYNNSMILRCISENSHNVTDTSGMYNVCEELSKAPEMDTSNVTNMGSMFSGCLALHTVPFYDTSKVTDMRYMFNQCSVLSTIPAFDTSNVTTMTYMFCNCPGLTSIPLLNTSKVTDMSYMFYMCSSLTNLPTLDTSKVTNARMMFVYAGIRNFAMNTSRMSNMYYMFYGCSNLTTVSGIDFSRATDVQYMFQSCSNLTNITFNPNQTTFSANLTIDLSKTNVKTDESATLLFNSLPDLANNTSTYKTQIIKLPSDHTISTEVMSIATDTKGWQVI